MLQENKEGIISGNILESFLEKENLKRTETITDEKQLDNFKFPNINQVILNEIKANDKKVNEDENVISDQEIELLYCLLLNYRDTFQYENALQIIKRIFSSFYSHKSTSNSNE